MTPPNACTAPPHPGATSAPDAPQAGWPGASAAVVDSASLLQGRRELLIHHQGHCYRLQATRQGKLILTK